MSLYRSCWEHLTPLANRKVASIGMADLENLLNDLPYGKSRVKSIRALLNHCFNYGLRLGSITANPVSSVQVKFNKPSQAKEINFWSAEQTKQFLNAAERSPFYPFYQLALHTGMRRGELLGLKWDAVDFTKKQIKVLGTWDITFGYREPKTKMGVRTISLRKNEVDILKGLHYPELVWVFQRHTEVQPWGVQTIQRDFTRICDHLGIPHIGLHGLRHTHATLALAEGLPVKVVSARLGHSSIGITLDTYRHVLPAEDAEAAETFGSILD